ncbi:diadenosine tetraphosphate (Ap4A) HIT family hydrolase [Nocardiopsis mwathae]|uniref:Diadenosine tetraphosphate (Ap4A) HIT family hydrolase n=1 Tax=Nocardiopsis mwathae TaxID=1472723 RepID=A0A7W9YK07_9ACTN|nr:HIT family protein [Nocardiopsis mwathae]MBB6173590.1 diadenosine tetraphosphate (Ap4A) HIT family hydrolase [Nocardiopsis mwathae]
MPIDPNTTAATTCVFCRIVTGDAPCHPIWEDDRYLAFLSIYPNTDGFSVVVTKAHRPSYVVDLDDEDFVGLHLAARETARRLDAAYPDVARTGIMYEGYGVDHAHAKLFPMHGTAGNQGENWRQVSSAVDTFFDSYAGYISSHDHLRADDQRLAETAKLIRSAEA